MTPDTRALLTKDAIENFRQEFSNEENYPKRRQLLVLCAMADAILAREGEEHIESPNCGFDRNGSHNAGHYVCNCGWEDRRKEPARTQTSANLACDRPEDRPNTDVNCSKGVNSSNLVSASAAGLTPCPKCGSMACAIDRAHAIPDFDSLAGTLPEGERGE